MVALNRFEAATSFHGLNYYDWAAFSISNALHSADIVRLNVRTRSDKSANSLQIMFYTKLHTPPEYN